jgi:hypothetical protein
MMQQKLQIYYLRQQCFRLFLFAELETWRQPRFWLYFWSTNHCGKPILAASYGYDVSFQVHEGAITS